VSTPIVQIYTIQTVAEARAVASLGIDRVGVTPAARGLPGEIPVPLAASIVDAIGDDVTVSALSVEIDPDAIVAMVEAVRPHVLHLCGPPGAVSPEAVAALRERLGRIEIMQAIAMVGEEAVATAIAYAEVADSLILVHDWNTSRSIVEAVDIPVVLAGGLSPENVANAIAVVGPWGVDSLTHTNQPLPGGGFRKDLEAVAAFAIAARGAGD